MSAYSKTAQNPDQQRQDLKLLQQFILRHSRKTLILTGLLLLVLFVLWLYLVNKIFAFGDHVDWSRLGQASSDQSFFSVVFSKINQSTLPDFMNNINPYLWWGVVLILTVVFYYIISASLKQMLQSVSRQYPSNTALRPLLQQLSVQAHAVLDWVWVDRHHPISIQDLYRTRQEIRQGRHLHLSKIQEQEDWLKTPRHRARERDRSLEPASTAEEPPTPIISASDEQAPK
ncbi:hypothetical protein [Brackiella oedipodis]|uniref:hypothetical protein n=1 Tax=Brackiella oedipodis TaxID=124225 RepID=UPI00048F70B9|nr:hypothetical protein [Brackiella oedipodis]